jgi:hypothetical protein
LKRLIVLVLAGVFLLGLLLGSNEVPGHRHDARADALADARADLRATRRTGIHKIRHVVIIM